MNTIETLFVPYELAVKLKELGFDEPCLAYHTRKKDIIPLQQIRYEFNELKNSEINSTYCSSVAPTYQQAFRWFREKYDLIYVIVKAESWFFTINGCNTQEGFNTYEEAELACLTKLIEIVEQQKQK